MKFLYYESAQFLFVFVMVKTWFTTEMMKYTAWFFNLSKSTAFRYIITWANFICFRLGCVPIWWAKGKVIEKIPECFKDAYPDARVIIDCTEFFCQEPSVLIIQSSLFFYYKHHFTKKTLVGISPKTSGVGMMTLW